MQPTLRQTPPSHCLSTIATFCFSCAARIAATYPAGPAPITTTSKFSAIYLSSWMSLRLTHTECSAIEARLARTCNIWYFTLQPAPHARRIAGVRFPKFLLEIGLFMLDDQMVHQEYIK